MTDAKKQKKWPIKFIGTLLLIVILLVGLYFSPLKSKIEGLYHDWRAPQATVETADNKVISPTPSSNLQTLKHVKDLTYNSTLYTFVVNDLMAQLTASDPIDIPDGLIDLLPTALKYNVTKIFLDAEISDGAAAPSVYELHDALQQNFIAPSAPKFAQPSQGVWASIKSWVNIKSWVKIEKAQKDGSSTAEMSAVKAQILDMQKALQQYDFETVKKIFTMLPENVQTSLAVWHDHLLLRETFFTIKTELRQAMIAFFQSNMNAAQKNVVIEYQIQPESESE